MIGQATVNSLIGNVVGNAIYLAKFYKFRINNPDFNFAQAMEIYSSHPEATICRSFDYWNQNGRRIKPKSKSIRYTNANNPNKLEWCFDIEQTYGVDYPPKVYPARKTLVQDLNKLNYIKQKYLVNHYDYLISTIKQFNMENGYSNENELEEKYLQRFIAIYLNATFLDSISIPESAGLDELDLDRKIELCEEAENIAQEIAKYIIEERNFDYEYEQQETKDVDHDEQVNTTTRQIWANSTKSSKKSSTSQISLFDTVGNTDGISIESAERVQQIEEVADEQITQGIETNKRLYEETTPRTDDIRYDGRNSVAGDNLSTVNNYQLSDTDFIRVGGAKTKYKDNVAAIKLVKKLDEENRQPTEDEQKILAKYIGWGGIPQVFDSENESWQKEYAELKEVLTQSEYDLAKSSVLTAHFTSKTIIDGMYKGLEKMGFTNGSILEPAAGTGNFIGLIPNSFDKTKIYGVEIDDLTGRIAKYLYPQSHIEIKGFEETNFKNNQFDGVITNVPFGAYKVYDRDYDKYNFFIHDYFIAKSIDKIKPNGICAVITSKGTMDKASTSFRKHIADRAELLGAIRLPNNAFKENAGTEVTADILFFKKRGTMIDANDDWIYTGTNEEGIPLNEYYINHPEMLLGTMKMGVSMYGSENETYLAPDDRTLTEALNQAIDNLPKNIYQQQSEVLENIDEDFLPADYNIRNYCYCLINDKVYMRVDDQMVNQQVAKTNYDRFKKMIEIRDEVRNLLQRQIDNCSDEELASEQAKLNSMYDLFIKKYGYLNSRFNRNLFRQDADYALLVSLENYDESNKTATKTDIFSKRTIRIHERVKSANNAQEALQISKNELGKVDIRYIEQLTGLDYNTVIDNLKNTIYKNPIAEQFENVDDDEKKYIGWETADEYLSGNVKQKLRIAKLACEDNEMYKVNVEALEQAQPEPIPASDISVRLGATWIDKKYYEQFLIEKFNIYRYYQNDIHVEYNQFDGAWSISAPSYCKYGVEQTSIYGTSRMNAFKIAEHCLNLQTVNIYDEVEDDEGRKKRVLNKPETIAAREKQRKLEQEFKDWIFDDQERRNDLVDVYNEKFNNTKLQNFNGDYLTFPEMNPCIELKKHQKDAVERIITSGNTLLHHVVGAGKTFEIAAAAMKLRQYGLASKPMIVVPNHLVMQWTREFKHLYPNANLLMATKKDLEKTNRLKFVSRVATGDWDAIVIAASSFEKIPLSKERQEKKIKTEIEAIEAAILDARKDGNANLTIKILERAKKNKEAVLKKLTDSTTKDSLIKFEDLGVDYLFVDEAHKYKNKFIFTKMNNVAGISKAMSQRATDLDMKCEYINELHHKNKGVVFATGTPISNSMVEMYTMQSYMQRDELAKCGLTYFDAWAANFGETQTALELAPSGKGYRTRTRFAKFTNLPELIKMYRSFADVKTADMLNLPTPKANKITITAKPTDEILRLNEVIQERAEQINNHSVKPEVDNMLKITNDGKKLALDPRLFDEYAKDDKENKVNLCIDNVFDIWEKTKDKKSTQIIFCDMSTPKYDYNNYKPEEDFDIYNDIKTKLVEKGIPPNEIRFIHEAKTDLQKQNLFDEVRNGNVRVIIGSTEKCGAGTNIQDKLIALHHLDTPYRPSDLQQREGRIVRQGNSNEEVYIYTYVTERTFDSYSYQILENKQKFISQIDNGDLTVREASDIDETTLSYAEIKAITTANPKIKQKMELEQELQRLHTLEAQYKNNKYQLQDNISKKLPQQINLTETNITNITADIERRNQNKSEEFSMKLGNRTFNERKSAGDLLVNAVLSNKYNDKIVGSFCGFEIGILSPNFFDNRQIVLVGNGRYTVDISTSGIGSITRIENFLTSLEEKLQSNKQRNEDLKKQLEAAKLEVDKPFEYADEIVRMSNELAELDAELDLNKSETPLVLDDEELQKEVAPLELEEDKDIDDESDDEKPNKKNNDMEM